MLTLIFGIFQLVLVFSSCPYDSTGTACNGLKYLVDSLVCADQCPTLYSPYQQNCPSCKNYCSKPTGDASILFTLELASVKDLTLTYVADRLDSSKKFINQGGIQYKSLTKNSPLPTLDRGFYFVSTSSMTSNQSYIPGVAMIINLVIKTLGSGEVLNVKLSSTAYIRLWVDTSGVFNFYVLLYDSNGAQVSGSLACTYNVSTNWQLISVYFYQLSCSTADLVFYLYGNTQGVTPLLSNELRFPSGTYTWTFGNTSSGNSFTGFIYWLQVRAEAVAAYSQTTSIDCGFNYYWDGSACYSCGAGCPTWPWCVRGGDCSYCYLTDCSACNGYNFSMCTACYTGIPPGCCDHLGATCTQTWSNTACQVGYFLIGSVCLYGCPYGFGNCAAVTSAVMTTWFIGAFSGSYGSVWITGTDSNKYNFWNSPETTDPFPAIYRGLYFNSNQFLAGQINFSHTWTLEMWVYAISGTILSHSSNALTIKSDGTINFSLEKWDGTYNSYSTSNPITINAWSFISYTVEFANKATKLTPYLNKASGAITTVTDYVFRFADGGTFYLGSPSFNGFIIYFKLWGIVNTDFSASYSIHTSTLTNLWPCDFSHYYTGTCQPCLSSCTIGCVRGTSCYICNDFLCAQCSSFGVGTCTLCIPNASGTPCVCNAGFYQPTNQALCTACFTGCNSCTGTSYYLCNSCSSSFFFYNSQLCLDNCPSGYTENAGTKNCDFVTTTGLSLSLYDKIQLDLVSGVTIGNSVSNSYPSYDSNDPYPAYLRGYYFTGATYMSTNTVIGPYFAISIWIYPTEAGTIAAKTVSGTEIFCLEILSGSGYPKLSLILQDSSAVSVILSEDALNGNWNFIAFTGKIDTSHVTTIKSYFNSLAKETTSSSNIIYFQDWSANTLYIGTKASFSSGFAGFLYDLNIFNTETLQYSDYTTSSCISLCASCPSDHNCPDTSSITQYYDGSTNINCMGSCSKGCRFTDTCRLCKTKQCYECTSFSGSCSSCITNAESDGSGGCQCKANAFWHSSTASCDLCDALCSACKQTTYFECNTCIGGKQMVGIICLNDCPYGYGSSCSSVTTAVIDQSFDTDFQGNYGIFTTGTDSSKYQHFVSPETIDPIPAYKRGLYFGGSMYLLSSVSVYISHSFSIGAWIYVTIDGDLLQKQIRLTLSSTGAISAVMEDPTQATSTQTLSPTSSFTGWAYISITIYYTSNASVMSIYINAVSAGSTTITGSIFRDQASTSLLLGKSSNPGFVGFIYYFQLWNTPVTDFSTIISSFTFCGSGQEATCLWECSISTYQDGGSCSGCNSCNKGCVRASTCNICDDLLCDICTGFDSGECTQCVSNASGAPSPCTCIPSYWISADGFSCQQCSSGCSQCIGLTYQKCTACFSGHYFFAPTGQCLDVCPSGYTANSSGNTCDFSSNIGISLDLTDQVHLDTVSNFNVGSVNTNTYPDWYLDSNDPIPSYKRGYYFYQTNYLSSSVIISPIFTISMWTKPLGAGILLTKYTSTDILKITIDSSGYLLLSMIFSDSLPYSLTATTSVINSWHFLSFTGEVQADGKTKLTLYINTLLANSFTTTALIYFKDANVGTLYIGNDETFGTSGLYGFLTRVNIYNSFSHQADDYATSSCSAECSVCPSNNQCLSNCALNEYPDSCNTCLTGCNQGCVSDLTCRLCRDKECYSCTTFSGECTSCITHAYKPVDHCMCLTNAIWVSSTQSCELCNAICATCSTLKFDGCLICAAGHYLIQSLCMTFCPFGYIENGNNCDTAYADLLVFNLIPHQIKNIVYDSASNIPVLTGKDNSFYPRYDATDPIAAIYRGYYFTGSSYMQLPPYSGSPLPSLTFAPKFVISAWIMPISDTGVIFCKQADSGGLTKYVSFELVSKFPSLTLTLEDSTAVTYTSAFSSLETTLSQWNFISTVSDISATPQQTIKLTTNTYTDLSTDLHPRWLNDLANSFLITIGSSHLDSTTFTSFFNGFIWDLKIYNTITTNLLVSSSCTGCSLCPVDNSNVCLDSCLIEKYWNGYSCDSCLPICSSVGCVRRDKNCNLCQDIICEICDDYTSTCITCKTHANLVGSSCQCDPGYYWNAVNEDCELCDVSCKTCTSPNFMDCLTCADGYYMASGICGTSCPLGYQKSVGGCLRVQEKMFDLDLNTLSGVIYDKASSIPVVTGSTKQFYPNYEADDPIPAYLRGFWFNGDSSILRLPEYSNYTSPRLLIAPTFTISIWLNIESSYSAILSKHDISAGYSVLYSISLMDSQPIFSSSLGLLTIYYICDASLKKYEWSHIAFTLSTNPSGYNTISCYANGISYPSALTGYGAFLDSGFHTTMTIGAQISPIAVYNFYKGFIYTIQMFNIVKSVSSLSITSCTEACNVCPLSQICIPNCKIYEYWSGPGYNVCYHCNIKCPKTCRDWRPTCSLCSNLLCDVCTDYSIDGCSTCKEHAINPDSCICDINYVLDTSNNTCIPLEYGGFRGSDGIFYSCPSHCTYCESLTKCTGCVENASLYNDLCYCNLGYNGAQNCSLVSFSASLAVLSDDSLYLTFSESLADYLAVNDFTIIIEKQGQVSYKMEQVNDTCYYITLSISKEVSKGSLVILTFFDLAKVRSASNGILSSSNLSAALNSYDPNPYSTAVSAVADQVKASVQIAISGAIALSVINPSPSSLWSMINTLQILSYLTLSGIPFTNKMSSFLNNLNSFNIFPNIFSYFLNKNEGNTPYAKAQDFGYDSDLILITTGNDFTIILVSLAAFPIFFFFSRCSYRWLGKKFMKTVRAYQFSFYLRFWIQSYLELGAAASIGLLTLGFKNATQVTNAIICLAIYALLVVTLPGYFLFSYKNRNRIQSREKTFNTLFSSLFYEFRTDRGLLATQYYFVFFLRRFIYIINLVFLREYPETEVTANIVLSLMTILHLIFYWPFQDPILQICNLLAEAFILVIMSLTSVYLFNLDQKIISNFESVIVGIVIVVMIIQVFASIAIFARTLYEIIYRKLAKAGIVKKDIHKYKPQPIKVKK